MRTEELVKAKGKRGVGKSEVIGLLALLVVALVIWLYK